MGFLGISDLTLVWIPALPITPGSICPGTGR